MRVLTVNVGSSSLKLSVVGADDRVLAEVSAGGDADPIGVLRGFIAGAGPMDAVAHRLVHGGPSVRRATILDDGVRRDLEEAAVLAPLHVPPALRLLDATRDLVDTPQVVCVDTAFHADLPVSAATYALPAEWRALGVRRYGFHGLSYAWSSGRCAQLLDRPLEHLQMVITHIGAGVSACAVRDGRSVDTSMGFTPLEGAVMATRSGSVDPGAAEMNRLLEQGSGLSALCGLTDMRDVERGAADAEPRCLAALEIYVHVLCRVIGGLAMSLDRLDALVFTGGVGQHSSLIRAQVCRRLTLLDVPAPTTPPSAGDAVVSRPGPGPAVLVVAAREDAQMAREARRALHG